VYLKLLKINLNNYLSRNILIKNEKPTKY
jgi:hypothetical protein